MSDPQVIVVGLGAMGSATCWQLAARGMSVLGIDRHHPPHDHGSTHGDTRITRLATAEGAQYVPLAQRSHELWRMIEDETGDRLLHQVGALMLSVPDSPFLATVRTVAQRFGIDHEQLDADELRRRFPMFTVSDDAEGYLEPAGGYVRPEPAVAAQLTLARRAGARLALGETVRGWTACAEGVTVTTDTGTVRGDQLVLCAGPWLPELLGGLGARFAIHRQHLYWYEIATGYEALTRMPVWIWDTGGERVAAAHLRGFYGFPAIDGPGGGLKLATEQYGVRHLPDGRQHPATAAQTHAMYHAYVRDRLPWLGPAAVRTVSCPYTCSPDSHFVIDRHPEHPAVMIVSPCSGHGFKHSAAIGEAVAQWVAGEVPGVDLGPFALDRQTEPGTRTAGDRS